MPQMDEVMHAPNIWARKRETERERRRERWCYAMESA